MIMEMLVLFCFIPSKKKKVACKKQTQIKKQKLALSYVEVNLNERAIATTPIINKKGGPWSCGCEPLKTKPAILREGDW